MNAPLLMKNPDQLCLDMEEEETIMATGVDIHFSVRGSNLFFGNAALEQAGELRQVLGQLEKRGFEKDKISLVNARSESSSGFLSRSSEALYSLILRATADKLNEAIGVLSDAKSTSVHDLSWRFDQLAEVRSRLLDRCAIKLRQKASELAAHLAVEVVGLHFFGEGTDNADADPFSGPSGGYGSSNLNRKMKAGRGGGGALDNLSLVHSRLVRVSAHARFLVASQ